MASVATALLHNCSTSLRSFVRAVSWPLLFALFVGASLLRAGAGSSLPGLVAYTFSAFVLAAVGVEFGRGTRARKELGDSTWAGAFTSLVSRNRLRYGGYACALGPQTPRSAIQSEGAQLSAARTTVGQRERRPSSIGRIRVVLRGLALSFVVLLLVLLALRLVSDGSGRHLDAALAAGKSPTAPDFSLPRLNGKGLLRLCSLRGKAVVLNFWAVDVAGPRTVAVAAG